MKRIKVVIIITVLAVMALGYFYYLSTKGSDTNSENNNVKIREVSKVLNKDLDSSYPATPREVIDFYSRVLICYYNEEYSDDELTQLTFQARKLLDEQLLASNPYDEYYERLKSEIEEYASLEKTISTYIISKNSEVIYKNIDEIDYAIVYCDYYLKGKDGHTKASEQYILRKDNAQNWKILSWKSVEPSDISNE